MTQINYHDLIFKMKGASIMTSQTTFIYENSDCSKVQVKAEIK